MRSRYQELVRRQAGLRPSTHSAGKRIIIIQAGRYNDRDDKAQQCAPGDSLVTKPWYARSLVQAGFAKWPDDLACLPGVSARTEQALRQHGYETFDDLQMASDEELLTVSGVGRKRLQRIRDGLRHTD